MARPKKNKEQVEQKSEVKVIRKYHDTVLNKLIEPGDKLKVTLQRAKELIDAKVAEPICLKN